MAASAPVGPWDIEGEIQRLQWFGATRSPAQPMMSGTLGGDRECPAYYLLDLRVTHMTPSPSGDPGGDVELAGCYPTMTSYVPPPPRSTWRSRLMHFIQRQPARSATPMRVATLQLPHPQNDGFLKIGMRIRITEYCEFGDEGGIETTFRTITRQSLPPDGPNAG
ncbi:hypothetical protein [Leptolyngbya iicbica]|uniref:Uncharacterized protein n=2 Tax=Cyanophyceae TaxID=3028117 RepID=A0A4Q7EDI4_9CYAN|nr:hypothetical protein [Leptolyngbya sp. LK]RZM79285.1 hypothetical protein DYY88_11075 [Leptolyngbya sp. LK]